MTNWITCWRDQGAGRGHTGRPSEPGAECQVTPRGECHLRAGRLCGPGPGLGPQREGKLHRPRCWDVWPEGWTMSLFLGPMLGGPAVRGTWDPGA